MNKFKELVLAESYNFLDFLCFSISSFCLERHHKRIIEGLFLIPRIIITSTMKYYIDASIICASRERDE